MTPLQKWSVNDDKKLYRLVCYLNSTNDLSLKCFLGDRPEHCHVVNYTDADFAGDRVGLKSTTGGYIAVVGPNIFVPITAVCKKQTCVSHSSTESEIVAAELTVRTEGLQALTFWEHVVRLF